MKKLLIIAASLVFASTASQVMAKPPGDGGDNVVSLALAKPPGDGGDNVA